MMARFTDKTSVGASRDDYGPVWCGWSGMTHKYSLCFMLSGCEGHMLTDTYLRVLAARCLGRRNDYALQQDNGRYLRVGSAVTLNALRGHVAGLHTMGTYVIDEQDCCRFVVFDADSLDGLVLLLEVQRHLAADGVSSALEGSRRGGHLWV